MKVLSLAVFAALLVSVFAAEPVIAAFPGRNGQIAFTTEIGDDLVDVFLHAIDPDGSGLRRINTDGVDAAFSPRGNRITYATAYGFGLRLKRADGRGKERVLTRGEDYGPDWSPSGRRIVFYRVYEGEDPIRTELRLYHNGRSRRLVSGAGPAWSIKGQIAFNRQGGIYVIQPDGSGLRRVVESGGAPDWSPDGRRLAFTQGGVIKTIGADGKGLRRLRRGAEPAYSPNGHNIAYFGGRWLMIMGAGGERPRRVPNSRKPDDTVEGDASQHGPDWQPRPRKQG